MSAKAELRSMNDRYAQLAMVEALTEKMLLNARQQQWRVVTKLEAERSELIDALFTPPLLLTEAEHVANFIRTVLAADSEIISLGESEQKDILQNSQKINRGKEAFLAYTVASSNK
ncbi:hypothetical protein MNBD_GAMMA17-1241 [hydrothermal vent metagenome]|uniref:Flagellar protein FliT n=1 Tax=hydrothermal vent metagenome TaxID=652676 RepID=A0A3B0ZPE2_9ZZZZ